jgi:apolipoprotein N-acyltransferase
MIPPVRRIPDGHAAWIAFFAGSALPLGFAPFGIYGLIVVSLSALWLLWDGRQPWVAGRIGFAWGAGAFLAGTYWLYISIHIFGGAPAPLAVFLMLCLVGIMALYPAAAGYVASRWLPSGPLRWLLGLPALWTLAEVLRGWLASGFPWLSLGYGMSDGPLRGYAALAGVHGVSLAVAVIAGALVLLLAGSGRRIAAAAAIAAILLCGQALSGLEWTRPADGELRVALLQGAVSQDKKWLPEELEPTKTLYLELTRENMDADLIVWPEAAIPSIVADELPYLEAVAAEVAAAGAALVTGMLERDPIDGRYFNALLGLGEEPAVYRKRHLVPFGEYFPVPAFVREWMRLMSLPYADITPGLRSQEPMPVAGQLAAPSICYEDAFGGEQLDFLPEATFLLNVSNDAWFGDSIAPHQHMQIARMRALETGRFMLRATNTGISAVIGSDGAVVDASPQFRTHVLRSVIQPRTGATPFIMAGNAAVVLLAAAMLGICLALRRR